MQHTPKTSADARASQASRDLSDVILDMPRPFRAKGRLLSLYPLTLAKALMLEAPLAELGIDGDLLLGNPLMEAVRLVGTSREACTAVLAIYTCPNTRRDLQDWKGMETRKKQLSRLSDTDMATLLVTALTSDKTDSLMQGLGLEEERQRMARVAKAKENDEDGSQSMVFGGLTLLGTFIGRLKEMGYDDDEIIFRRSYSYLRLMLADKVSTIYLTKEERDSLGVADGGKVIDGSDPQSVSQLEEWLAKRGMKMNADNEQSTTHGS